MVSTLVQAGDESLHHHETLPVAEDLSTRMKESTELVLEDLLEDSVFFADEEHEARAQVLPCFSPEGKC